MGAAFRFGWGGGGKRRRRPTSRGHSPAAVLGDGETGSGSKKGCPRERVDCQASATVWKKTSKGVRQPSRLRGLWLIRSRTRSNSACDTSRKLQPRGKKYRSSPLAFSLQPLCHGLCGCAKYTGALICSSNSRNSANSDPLSRDRLFTVLSFSASTIAFLVSLACLE